MIKTDKEVFIWRNAEDSSRFVDAIAQKLVTELFNVNSSLTWLDAGKDVPVNKTILHQLINKHFVSVRLTDQLVPEYFSFDFPNTPDASKQPNERSLLAIIDMLLERVAKGPQEPVRLTPQRQQEARARLKMGERPERIAAAFGAPVEAIRQLVPGQ